jgi:hypothetical protein
MRKASRYAPPAKAQASRSTECAPVIQGIEMGWRTTKTWRRNQPTGFLDTFQSSVLVSILRCAF